MRCRSQNQSNKQQEASVGREHSPTKENSLNSLGNIIIKFYLYIY
jgi:hypothetical protein